MMPPTVAHLPLHQIASQQQDAIVFDVNSITSLGNEATFLIFYLSKEDEFNGYGTVIQLDQQSKQAAIYADLNPEYTYLFYLNEQNQIQTLLWCIEVATQTADGLFIAHAKSYGRGISGEDLARFKQVELPDNQPQSQHALAESYAPAPQPTPAQYAPNNVTNTPTQTVSPAPALASTNTPTIPAAPVTVDSPPVSVVPAAQPTQPAPQPAPSIQATLPISPPAASAPVAAPVPPTPETQPLSFIDEPADELGQPIESDLNLPPLSTTQSTPMPAPTPTPSQPIDILQPIMPMAQPMAQSVSSLANQSQSGPKQPVGRPPKPLLEDQLWSVSPEDFIWVKNMSRQPIAGFKDALHQKTIQQIRTNKPGLIEDWQFTGIFEQAFSSLCTTYELIPALRHDILKALLNGRVVENIRKSQSAPAPTTPLG